ncbi:MAG: pilus assembly protein PilM, partial [Planctomycetota bacterium]|jgi:type IV pilus assembly protein PilM
MLAARDEVIQDHLEMLVEMGLSPQHIEAEPVALFRNQLRYLRRQSDDEAVSVVIDIGVRGTCVVVARGRDPVFVKFIDIGGHRMTEAVARQLNLSYPEARQMRLRAAKNRSRDGDRREGDLAEMPDRTSVDWTIRDAIRSEVEALSREIALCLRYCSVTFRGLRPDGVTLMGGQACDPLCVDMMAEQLNMDCSVCQPLRNVESSAVSFGDDRRGMMTDWALCTGLATYQADFAQDKQDQHGSQNRLSA